jgi:hypothetical protein
MATAGTATVWDKRNLGEVEQIHPNVTRSWLENGRIVCFTLTSVARPAVDAWLNASEDTVQSWPIEVPYRSIHDLREADVTPYIRQQSAAAVSRMPTQLKGRSAVVVPRTFTNQLIRLIVTIDLVRINRNIQRNVFFTQQDAINWVLEERK